MLVDLVTRSCYNGFHIANHNVANKTTLTNIMQCYKITHLRSLLYSRHTLLIYTLAVQVTCAGICAGFTFNSIIQRHVRFEPTKFDWKSKVLPLKLMPLFDNNLKINQKHSSISDCV